MNSIKPPALITGASSGIGTAFALALANKYDLILSGQNKERLEELSERLMKENHISVEILVADLSRPEGIKKVEKKISETPNLGVLINNAGVGSVGPFEELDIDAETSQIHLNVIALTRLTHAAVRVMLKRKGGSIINVSSLAGLQPAPYSGVYGGGKAYVKTFSESLHEEYRERGIVIQCLCPGLTHTEFQERGEIKTEHIPDMMWMEADEVVAISLAELENKTAVCIPGLLNTATSALSKILPDGILARVAGSFMRKNML